MQDDLDPPVSTRIPPNYSPGSLPKKPKPFEAVPRVRSKFYGPLTGPFSIDVPGDKLQVGPDWEGYIQLTPHNEVRHLTTLQFEQSYERLEEAAGKA